MIKLEPVETTFMGILTDVSAGFWSKLSHMTVIAIEYCNSTESKIINICNHDNKIFHMHGRKASRYLSETVQFKRMLFFFRCSVKIRNK